MSGAPTPLAYAPGVSRLHRLSPVPKLAWLVAAVAFAFATYHPAPLLAVAAAGLVLAVGAGAARPALRAVAVFGPLAASIVVLQAIAPASCGGACTVAARIGPLAVTDQGLTHGIELVARILAMETVAVAVLVTTHPSDLFGALRRLRVPYAVAFMLSLTMSLVPVMGRELGLVLAAQRARGLRAAGFAAVVPAFLPAFVATFERVQQLAMSMEARGFGATAARTSWRRVRLTRSDGVLAVAGVAAGIAGVAAGIAWWGVDRTPVLYLPAPVAVAIVAASLVAFVGGLAAALAAMARE
jgi:energy-coupling factor transport system permease protein